MNRTRIYQYPGDPETKVTVMFGGEFREMNPNRETIISFGNEVTRIPVEEVICDACNRNIDDVDPCALTDWGLYCWPCFEEQIKRYLKEEKR